MLLDWMNIYIDTLKAEPIWLLGLIFLVAFVEAFAVIGVVVPGVVLLFALSLAIGLEPGLFFSAWLVAALGALSGDSVSFWLGQRWQPNPQASRYGDVLDRARDLFGRHGGKSIFIGRFVGPIRPVIPLVGGMLGMPWRQFLSFAIPACILWAPIYLLPGMIFGASLELAAAMAGRLAVVMVALVLGIWSALWFVRVVYTITAKRSTWWIKRLVQWSNRHRLLGRLVGDLFRPGSREVMAIAFLGLVLAVSLTVLLVLLIVAPSTLPQWTEAFHPATWASSLRNQWTDPWMVGLSLVGDVWVMGALALVMALVMIISGRWIGAGHGAVAVVGVWLLALGVDAFMNALMSFSPPEAIAHDSFMQLPHRGLSVMVTVLAFFAVMVSKDLSARARKWPYLISAFMVLLISFAHFYLELASLLGISAAWALGVGWSALVGMGYRHRATIKAFPTRLVGVFVLCWIVFAWAHVEQRLDDRLVASQVPIQSQVTSVSAWQGGGWRTLPDQRSLLGPPIARVFDFQVAGERSALRSALVNQGWEQAEPITWRLLFAHLGRGPVHWPRALNGRAEALLMTQEQPNGQVTVLRLWASGLSVMSETNGQPVWLGQVRRVQAERGFLGFQRWFDVADDEPLLTLEASLAEWPFIRSRPLWSEPNQAVDPDEPQALAVPTDTALAIDPAAE